MRLTGKRASPTEPASWCAPDVFASMGDEMSPGSRRARGARGAVAVEFALLMPIFVMLTFGMITAGIGFWRYIEMTQAARDSARYGSTLPIDPAGALSCPTPVDSGIGCWLESVRSVATATAGWVTPTNLSDGDGYVCVAYVKGGTGKIPDKALATGSVRAGDAASGNGPCFTDNLTGPRVQVVIRRDNPFNAVFFGRTWEMRTKTVLPYERDTK